MTAHAAKRVQDWRESRGAISAKGLIAIAEHKYMPGEYTPLDYVLYRFWWDPVVALLPNWLAPNVITFVGFLSAFVTLIPVAIYNPSLSAECPSWVFVYTGVSFLFYMMMDAIDGKQARRTGSSSPLGQLFDHGCDCILSGVLAILLGNALGLGLNSGKFILLMSSAQIAFFVGMWEEKYVGSCRTTIGGVIGTTEYLLMFVGAQFMAGTFPWFRALPWLQDSIILFVFGSGVFGTLICTWNVFRGVHGWKLRGKALQSMLPIWAINYVFNYHVHPENLPSFLPFMLLAFINAYLIIQMIVATVSRTEFVPRQFAAVVAPSIIFFLLPNRGWTERCLWGYLGFFVHLFLSYLLTLVGEISSFLGIRVFKIKPPKAE